MATQSLLDGENPLTERDRDLLAAALEGAPVSGSPPVFTCPPAPDATTCPQLSGKTGASARAEAAQVAQSRGWRWRGPGQWVVPLSGWCRRQVA
ncbi:MAG: hypothetical protein ACK5LN_01965 [Propioniciclava sp.]